MSGIAAELAIVIDDLGYHADRAERIPHLPGPLTFAVLPNTPGGVQLAQRAPGFGKAVILPTNGSHAISLGIERAWNAHGINECPGIRSHL